MSQFIVYRIAQDGRPVRAIVAPATVPADSIPNHLRPGERVVWAGNLVDALGLPVTLIQPARHRPADPVHATLAQLGQQNAALNEAMDTRRTQSDDAAAHTTLARLFLGSQVWRDTCWKCGQELANPLLPHCPHCGAGTVPF